MGGRGTTNNRRQGRRQNTDAVVPGTAVSRRQAEEQAKGIRQILWAQTADARVPPEVFSAWSERAWVCPGCQMPNMCGFLICLSCKALPLFQDEKSGVAFSPVAQAYLQANVGAINKDRAKGPGPASNLVASDVHVAQPVPARMCKFSSICFGKNSGL